MRRLSLPVLAVLACTAAAAQTTPPAAAPAPARPAAAPVEPIPDPVKLPASEVPYVHPLFRPLDAPAKLTDRPNPADLKIRTTLYTTARVDEKGRVSAAEAVNPPLAALAPPVATLFPKWRFSPATRAGVPVTTWATYGVDLEVELEKANWVSFGLSPVAKDLPMAPLVADWPGESWINDRARYPHDITPKDASAVSIEDVDILPSPEKTNWSFSSARVRSHLTALVEVTSGGLVRRLVATNAVEPLLLTWVKRSALAWKLAPATAAGKPVDSWMTLDATLEYTVEDANEKGKRLAKKNLRAVPPA